jgi:antitoxin component YwqK of YwqJK toxin-antitoxin module
LCILLFEGGGALDLKEMWDDEGNLLRKWQEVDGKIEGEMHFFYPSKGISHYKNGLLHGPSIFFSEKGNILSKSEFYLGKLHGKRMAYYLSGSIYAEEEYVLGKREGQHLYFYENGKIKTLLHYVQDLLDGEVVLFWPDGREKRRLIFQKGTCHVC